MTRPAHDVEPKISKEALEEMRKHVAKVGKFEGEIQIELTREALDQMIAAGKNLKREINWSQE